MITLRVELEPSLAAMVVDPGGAFWPGRVQDWRNAPGRSAYNNLNSPRITYFPTRAVVYVGAPDNVMERNLEGLRQNWSTLVWSVNVRAVEIVHEIPTVADEVEEQNKRCAFGPLCKFGEKAGQVVTILAVGAAVALAIYAARKGGGTREWL